MAFKDKINKTDGGEPKNYRWQNILNLSDHTPMYDLSTGKRYTVGQFRPIHITEFGDRVEEFGIKGTDDRVWVSFLRKLGDSRVCSIGGLSR